MPPLLSFGSTPMAFLGTALARSGFSEFRFVASIGLTVFRFAPRLYPRMLGAVHNVTRASPCPQSKNAVPNRNTDGPRVRLPSWCSRCFSSAHRARTRQATKNDGLPQGYTAHDRKPG